MLYFVTLSRLGIKQRLTYEKFTPPYTFYANRIIVILLLLILSCSTDENLIKEEGIVADYVDPEIVKTPEDVKKANTILNVTKVLRKIYKDRNVVEEVNAAVATGYYSDERIMLKDLLHPESSPVYQQQSFLQRKAARGLQSGIFKEAFEKAIGIESKSALRTDDLYFDENGIYIYFPYYEDTQYSPDAIAVVPATIEADQAYIDNPDCSDEFRDDCWPRYTLVNDNFASGRPVHVVGMGPSPVNSSSSNSCAGNFRVKVSYVQILGHQYDRLFSFENNGGGPDLVYVSAKSDHSGTKYTWTSEVKAPEIKRKQVRNSNYVQVNRTLDNFWGEQHPNQMLGIYEHDYSATDQYMTGELQYTNYGGVALGTSQYHLRFDSKNSRVHHQVYERSYYLYLINTYRNAPDYLQGLEPQFRSSDNHVNFIFQPICID